MKLSIAFPVLALSFALVGCDDHRSDWADADVARRVEEASVPQLVDKASPAAPEPSADDASAAAPEQDAAKGKAAKAADAPGNKAEPEIDVDADLYVKRLVVAHGVEGREPVSPATTFTKGADAERVYAFVEVGNKDRSPSAISVSFVREGQPDNAGVELRVGASPRWRTWAYTRQATEPGVWHVVVRGPKGQELARGSFEIVAGEAKPQASFDADGGEEIAADARG